jgi:hypothetical protein
VLQDQCDRCPDRHRGGNLRAAAMAEHYLVAVIGDVVEAGLVPGPFLYAVSARGLRRLNL